MIEKIKKLIGIGTPGGIDDVIVRAVKLAVYTFIGGVTIAGTPVFDVPTVKVAAIAAGGAAVSVILNALLLWAKPE